MPASVYVGTTWEVGNTNGSPPSLSGVDYTRYGNEVRGTTGYVILYGSNFTSPYGDTNVYSSFGTPAYLSDSQINLYYSIPLDTASGTYGDDIDISTPYSPDAYANFYVYDPVPVITGMSPDITMMNGASTSITVSGSGFGLSTCPTLTMPSGVSQTAGPSSCSDTSFTVSVQAGFGASISRYNLLYVAAGGGSDSWFLRVNGPAYMVVSSDVPENVSGNLDYRYTQYNVMNYDGTSALGPEGATGGGINIAEDGSFSWVTTCMSGGSPAAFGFDLCDGTYHTAGGNVLSDMWHSFYGDTPSGCGGTINYNYDHWQWCGGTEGPSTGITFGTLSGAATDTSRVLKK